MAILSDYTAGTVSSSGTTITGTGTGWKAAEFQEGDIFIAAGYWAIVASVVSNTQLTLVDWAGPVLSGSAYRLRYTSDGSRASAQARQLIDLLGGSGSIEALAGLTGTPNTMPFFTGPGTAGTTSLTPFARTFLGRADAAAARAGLGATSIGSSLFTAADAAAARAALVVGGTVGLPIPNNDYNLAIETGFYAGAGSAAANGPAGPESNGPLVVLRAGPYIVQRAQFDYDAGLYSESVRGSNNNGSTWSPWVPTYSSSQVPAARIPANLTADKAFRRGNILGPVSQSGGVPTGAFVESVLNANGRYVRWADGTQECFTAQQIFLDSNLYQNVTMPAAFAANSFPRTLMSFATTASSGSDTVWQAGVERLVAYATPSGVLYLLQGGGVPASGIVYGYHVGRWL